MSKYNLAYVYENYCFVDPKAYHENASRWSKFPKGIDLQQETTQYSMALCKAYCEK